MLKTSAYGLGFQHLPRDLANVNAWKTMFDPYIQCDVKRCIFAISHWIETDSMLFLRCVSPRWRSLKIDSILIRHRAPAGMTWQWKASGARIETLACFTELMYLIYFIETNIMCYQKVLIWHGIFVHLYNISNNKNNILKSSFKSREHIQKKGT